ncbi:MAG: hypothetical protein ABID54_12095, partial [Pseudomonadota bacterium]
YCSFFFNLKITKISIARYSTRITLESPSQGAKLACRLSLPFFDSRYWRLMQGVQSLFRPSSRRGP